MTTPAAPTISILTPSFNQGAYIEQTIRSVMNQNYPSVEHIVVDGGSTDDTVALLKKYPHLLWSSQADRGQADALNKGLARASGDIVGWINSDDYYEANIFAAVADCFRDPKTQWAVGNLKDVFDATGDVIVGKSPIITYERLIAQPDIVRQPPTFFRRAFLERVGGWNADFFMVMDFDLWIRLSRLSPPRMVEQNWAYFRTHALQKTSHANILRQAREMAAVLRRERVSERRVRAMMHTKRWFWIKGRVKSWLLNAGVVPQKFRQRPLRMKSTRSA